MKCPIGSQEHKELLLAYGSRSLDAGQTAKLEAHLRECPACRELAGAQKTVWEALDTWEAAPVSVDFDRRLYQRIEKEVSWWDLLMRPFRPLLIRQGLPIAAMACLVLVAGLLIQRPSGSPQDVAPESAKVEAMPPEQVQHALDEMETIREFNRLLRPEAADPKM